MIDFLQQLINGLGRGANYALWAVGYGMVFQVLGLMHFAHGDTILLALYIAFSLLVSATLPAPIAIVIVIVLGAVLAAVVERSVYRPLVKIGNTAAAFIAALGAAYILRNIATLIWGRQSLSFPDIIPSETLRFGGLTMDSTPLVALAVALVVVGVFSLFLKLSRHGQAIVAVGQDRGLSGLMGVNVNRVIVVIYMISGAVGVIGALMFMSQFSNLNASIGFFITMKAFFAAIIGGLGRLEGALLGGLLLGVLEAMFIGYVSGVFADAFTFALLGALLLIRPTGIMGRKTLAKV